MNKVKKEATRNYSKEELMDLYCYLEFEGRRILRECSENSCQTPLIGDMRTQAVQKGNYQTIYNGNKYYMSSFTGIVTDVKVTGVKPIRARIVMELQNGKRLSFFANIDEYIKENSIIEAVGVCLKDRNGFYNFKCIGGYRRIITNEEFNQLLKGVSFDNLKIKNIPWDIISCVKETERINIA